MFYSLYFKSGCYEYLVCNVGEKTGVLIAGGLNTVSVRVLHGKTLWGNLSLFSGSGLREPVFVKLRVIVGWLLRG